MCAHVYTVEYDTRLCPKVLMNPNCLDVHSDPENRVALIFH